MHQDMAGVGEEGAGVVFRIVHLPHVILPEPGNLAGQSAVLEGGVYHDGLHTKPAWRCSNMLSNLLAACKTLQETS